jgi:hypothetical protein
MTGSEVADCHLWSPEAPFPSALEADSRDAGQHFHARSVLCSMPKALGPACLGTSVSQQRAILRHLERSLRLTALGVWVAADQIRVSRQQSVLHFEDDSEHGGSGGGSNPEPLP